MITSARPMAMSRSRVHTRISLRNECGLDPEGEVLATGKTGSGDSGIAEVGGSFSSALSIFWLPCIYSTGVARRARFDSQRCDFDATSGIAVGSWIQWRREVLPWENGSLPGGDYSVRALFREARAAITAVSVRRISLPREASRKAAFCAAANSSSVN